MRRILVTGASGFVGQALISRLADDGIFRPLAVMRRHDVSLPAGVEVVRVTDLDQLTTRLAGIDTIIHAAARVTATHRSQQDQIAEFRKVNVESTVELAEAAACADVRRFIFISSVAVNGLEPFPQPFDERHNPTADTPYGQSKLEAEQALHAISARTKLEVAVIRPPLVYAANASGNFGRLLRLLKRGLPLPIAATDNKRSYISLANLVDFCIRCVAHEKAANETFLVADDEDLSTVELVRAVSEGMGRRSLLLPIPLTILKFATSVLGRDEVYRQLCGSRRIDSSKARSLLNWRPPVSARTALAEAGRLYLVQK